MRFVAYSFVGCYFVFECMELPRLALNHEATGGFFRTILYTVKCLQQMNNPAAEIRKHVLILCFFAEVTLQPSISA